MQLTQFITAWCTKLNQMCRILVMDIIHVHFARAHFHNRGQWSNTRDNWKVAKQRFHAVIIKHVSHLLVTISIYYTILNFAHEMFSLLHVVIILVTCYFYLNWSGENMLKEFIPNEKSGSYVWNSIVVKMSFLNLQITSHSPTSFTYCKTPANMNKQARKIDEGWVVTFFFIASICVSWACITINFHV